MICLLQRVSQANVTIENKRIAEIGPGMLIFFCAEQQDLPTYAPKLASKITKMRIFPDSTNRMNQSILQVPHFMPTSKSDLEILIVPQFTLAADIRKGNRPGYHFAASPENGKSFFDDFVKEIEGILDQENVQTGVFGTDMNVGLNNIGPATFIVDSSILSEKNPGREK